MRRLALILVLLTGPALGADYTPFADWQSSTSDDRVGRIGTAEQVLASAVRRGGMGNGKMLRGGGLQHVSGRSTEQSF